MKTEMTTNKNERFTTIQVNYSKEGELWLIQGEDHISASPAAIIQLKNFLNQLNLKDNGN